ncbi:FAD-dependent oxidoreductase [Candidatus Nomurabacteria bacterium]|nr:FAD-dependent oxidoreductase [Candidatus Nomurabacteria bacterium]
MIYDLIIIGGGPAGVAAGVYAARKKLRTLFLTTDFGGQSSVSAEIQNWIGTRAIPGEELARQLREHLFTYESPDFVIKEGEKVTKITQKEKDFIVSNETGDNFEARAVLITTGAMRRKLEVPGAKEFEQKGITYCATCDGPLFADQDVVVIGGGNAAFETAAQLLAYCRSVTLIHRGDTFRADEITVERVRRNPKMKIITNAELKEFRGDKMLTSLVYQDTKTNEEKKMETGGVFVEIGLVPTTWFAKDLVKLNQNNSIVVDPRTQASSIPGVWAAGDCTDALYHQNNIAAGDAIKALENIYQYLHARND